MTAPPRTSWWCARAWLGEAGIVDGVEVAVRDGVITEVRVGVAARAGIPRLDGLVLPGFANVHSHAFHRALRGRTERAAGTFWSWREAMYDLASRLTPDSYRDLATAVFAEMACAGFSSVGEFHYLHHGPDGTPYKDPNEMSVALLDAAHAAGVRLTLLDACYLEAGPGHPAHGVQRRFSDATPEQWAERVGALGVAAPRARIGAAIHSVRAVAPEAAEVVAAWATAHAAPLHAHVSEQPRENDECLATYASTPTALLARAGVLSPRFTAVHATHLAEADRWLLGDAGVAACICPTTERNLADGLCELGPLVAAGVSVCIGSDCHATIDPFEELRCLEGHERLRSQARATLGPETLLTAGTSAGHAALGWPAAGRIAPGAPCDLVCVETTSTRLAGADGEDLLSAVLASATADDVAMVVVDGALVASGGAHSSIDVPVALDRAIRAAWS